MPVFFKENTRVLYIHVPKTGGTFIESTFKKNGFSIEYYDGGRKPGKLNQVRKCSPQHMHSLILEAIFDLSKFDYIFMTVRNPIDRFISEFRMRRKDELVDINKWLREKLKQYRANNYINDNHLRPQIDFYIDGITYFKQEDKYDQKWINKLSEESKLKLSLYGVENALVRDSVSKDTISDVKSSLSTESLEILKSFYIQDFIKFNYLLPS